MTKAVPMDVLLGIGFGEVLPDDIGILASMHVQTTVKGKLLDGVRDPMILQRAVLEQLQEHMPSFLALVQERGLDQDSVPLPTSRIQWNQGPTVRQAQQTGLFLCTGFGFSDPVSGHSTPIAYVEGVPAHDMSAPPQGGEYVMPYRVLVEFAESIPKVLQALKAGSPILPAVSDIDFDFDKLNFKWDPAKRKITMNRDYLSGFLESFGLHEIPGTQQLMDVLAQLYVLHVRKGGKHSASMESCLRTHGIKVTHHDPATISPARREMDNKMDAVLLAAMSRARDSDAVDFWNWIDAEIAPIQTHAQENGEAAEFEKRYGEVMQLAKDAGLARIQ